MAGDDAEVAARVRRRLEEEYGMREAAYLMDRPSGGWESLPTKEYIDLRFAVVDARFEALDHRFDALRHEFLAHSESLSGAVDRRLRAQTWITTTTLIAGLALAFGAGRLG